MTQYTKDMFNQIIQDYDQLKKRAEEVFDIRSKYLKSFGQVRDIDLCDDMVEITTEYYCRGDTDTLYYGFPMSYLLNTNEELDGIFNTEKLAEELKNQQEKEKEKQKEQARTEKFERGQLAKYLAKYGLPEDYNSRFR
jgi:hypothetical protein